VLEAGVPIQVISDKWEFAIQILDLSESTPEQQERELRERMTEKVQQAFDLSLGPLLRCQLLRLSEREHVLIVHMHHIVSDGWSVGIMIRELTALYGAYGRDEESPLAGLKLQYADFAVWQREWLQGVEADTQLSYWKRQLAGAPPLLELPTDRPRPDIQTFNGARKSIFLPSNLYKSLKVMCHQENVTFFMMLLTGLNMLLHYYTDCDDIIVGTDVANRHIADTEAVIGLFVNQLVLRTDLSGDPDCRELLARVREMLIEAYSHQDLPFDRVVEVLNPERNLKHSPLFQVKLLLQNFPRATPAFAGLTLSYLTFERKTAELDLIISITETNDGLDLSMEYNTDLFNSSTIIMMANHYETLLRIIADQPEVRLSHVKSVLEKADERHSLAKREIRKRDNLKKLKSINRRAVADYIKVEDEHGCS
jgi:non-ribosomal peptide synthetase component F